MSLKLLRRPQFLAILLVLLLLPVTSVFVSAQNAKSTVSAATTTTGVPTLVGPDGRTLYTLSKDDEGKSTCYDECALVWPPLTVDAKTQPTAAEGVPGKLGTVARTDGSRQVTYDGWPLYYYREDAAPGDAKGQGIGDIWFAASPASVMVATKPGLGDMLVGSGGLTLYVFMQDEVTAAKSSTYCNKDCTLAWPPLIMPPGKNPTAGAHVPGTLGTTKRLDGTLQVMYNGWPLYFFKGDHNPGDTMGNGAKKVWYVATPDAKPQKATRVNVNLVAQGLTAPVALVSAHDKTGRLFIADQAGKIRIVAGGKLLDKPFLDLTGQLVPLTPAYDERGLIGLAFHPDYANNGRFFVYYSAPLQSGAPNGWNATNILAEFHVSKDDPNQADPGSQKILLKVDKPQMNHNGGQIIFGPDGDLYLPLGDGGGANDTDMGHTPGMGNGQDTSKLLGKILRIDVNSGQPYGIPADNPFVGKANIPHEIFAYGFRNPFHLSFDAQGNLYASDAGQELYEEIDKVTAGGNYGWHIREGFHCFDPAHPTQPPADCAKTGADNKPLIDPLLEIDHRVGVVVVGGFSYQGSAVPQLTGKYIFGEYTRLSGEPSGKILAAQPSAAQSGKWDWEELEVTKQGGLGAYVLSFGQDDKGEIYVLTTEKSGPTGDTGKVWRLAAS